MSEYQDYEFQAVDRPLGEADLETLRAVSTSAHHDHQLYEHFRLGRLQGRPGQIDGNLVRPASLLANWGSRRLMVRWRPMS